MVLSDELKTDSAGTVKVLRDPLVHFLVLGLGLFLLFELVASDEASYNAKIIDVDREALLTFVQYRLRAFEPRAAAARLDNMSEEEMERLVRDYVREEALHREALSLGMDKNDYVIKRRLIQSIEFIADDFANVAVEVSDEDVRAYFDTNRQNYYVAPFVTFTHVFFDAERRGREESRESATAKLAELNDQRVPFNEGPRQGDRFPFFVNYVERDPQFVTSHFGVPMAEAVFALEASDSTWAGPFESEYGAHLVLLTRKAEGRYPKLAEVEASVRDNVQREAIQSIKDAAIQRVVDTYEVRRSYEHELLGMAR